MGRHGRAAEGSVLLAGRYELIEPVGRGGMAEVWCAKDVSLGRLVAVKLLDRVPFADPHQDPEAIKYDELTFQEALANGLKVADATAFALCMENGLPMVVFGMEPEGNILKVVQGEKIGTLVSSGPKETQ